MAARFDPHSPRPELTTHTLVSIRADLRRVCHFTFGKPAAMTARLHAICAIAFDKPSAPNRSLSKTWRTLSR